MLGTTLEQKKITFIYISQNIFLYVAQKKKVIQIWNDIRVNDDRILIFWVNNPVEGLQLYF